MWLEKTLSDKYRRDKRLIYASIKSVIDPEWDKILSRDGPGEQRSGRLRRSKEPCRHLKKWLTLSLSNL